MAGGGRGRGLLAFSKTDGSLAWKAEDDKMTHATPIVAEILGTRQVIFFTQTGLVSMAPATGKALWRYDFPFKTSTAASPVVYEDIVYCSAGYGVGGGAVRVSKSGSGFNAKEIWRTENKNINHWSTPVCKDGNLYGMFSFKDYGKGPLACVDIRTGEQMWEEGGFGPGNVILTGGGKILALGDRGQLVLVEANPRKYDEIARTDILDGKCWSTPVLSNGRIYARSVREAVCLDVGGTVATR